MAGENEDKRGGNNPTGQSGVPDLVELRRHKVAQLLVLRPGISRRQVVDFLGQHDPETGQPRLVNPETGNPFSLGTIQNDIAAIKDRWIERADEDIEAWVAGESAKLDELEAACWRTGNYDGVLRIITFRARLFGLCRPAQVEANVGGDIILRVDGGEEI